MKYITVAEASKKWGLTPRSVQLHCLKGNVPGATLQGKSWRIPIDAVRPLRKPRAGKMPTSVLVALKAEKRGRLSGGLYHRLQEWRQGSRERLLDTCRAGQDVFVLGLRKFGYDKLAGRAGAERM